MIHKTESNYTYYEEDT